MAEMTREGLLGKLGEAKQRIQALKDSCCTNTRHCMFDDLAKFVGDVEKGLAESEARPLAEAEQKKIADSGRVLGVLAVSCCIPERIQNYAECIALLNEILFKSFELKEAE